LQNNYEKKGGLALPDIESQLLAFNEKWISLYFNPE